MRIARFSGPDGSVSFGVVDGVGPGGEDDGSGTITPVLGHPFGALEVAGPPVPLSGVRLLAPVLPSKIVAVGKNYAAHAQEMGGEVPLEPMIFLKPSTAVIGPGDPITLPEQSERVEHEAELAVVIGRLCSEVPIRRVPEVVLGYTCANDVTARDLQNSDGQWTRAKGYDTFCPIGPWIVTHFSLEEAGDLGIRTRLDGALVQDASTNLLVRDVATLVSYVSSFCTLLPGDLILTGTPAGVGPMTPGQHVEVEIDGIGVLDNVVVEDAGADD